MSLPQEVIDAWRAGSLVVVAGGRFPLASARALAAVPVVITTSRSSELEGSMRAAGMSFTARAGSAEAMIDDAAGPRLVYWSGSGVGREGGDLAAARAPGPEIRRTARRWMQRRVVLLVGYRLDDREFGSVIADLAGLCGGEIPRCHAAVPAEGMTDVLWQKWAWKGVVVFAADPGEALTELEDLGR